MSAVTEADPRSNRQAPPFHCPYCGDEEIVPHGDVADAWLCRACLRAFSVRLIETGVTP